MAVAKTAAFTEQDQQLATWAKALGHPARMAIVRILARRQACICGDIVDELPLSQSTVSQHLRELKSAGLIKGEVDGPRVCYCLNTEAWREATEAFGLLFSSCCNPNECC